MIQNRQLLVPVLPALVLLLAMRASGQTLYYDTSSASQNSNSVQHVTPAGAANTSIFTATGSGGNNVSRCTAIALDTSLQKVFLVDAGNQELWSMNLDGSGLSLVKAGLTNTPTDLALDTVNQMIYYTTSSATVTNNTIQRMDYTGNNNTVLFTAGTSGNNVSRCTALALDLKNSLIFFSDAGVKGIWSLNLSGSGLTLINSNLTAVPLDLALDVTNKFIYYATSSSIQNSNTVQKLNYAGNANTLLFTATGAAGNGVSRCTAIDFDPAGSKLYLADAGTNALWSLNIDGSGLSQVELNLLPTPRRVRFIPPVAPPTTYTWNNPAGGNWNLPGNWSPPTGVPGGSDTAIISDPGSYTVTVSDREAVGTLTMSGASGTQTLNINSGGTLLINKASTGNANAVVNVNGGTLNGIGSLALTGRLNWTGGTISLGVLFGGGGFSSGSLLLNGGMLTNSGVLNWSNNATLDDGNGSVFTNLPGATIIVSNTSSTTWVNGGYYGGSHVFGNGGTITVGASGTLAMNFENFVNAGTLTVNSGTLSLSGGSLLDSGPVNVTSGATLELGGADTFTPASSISGAGNLLVSGGTAALNSGLGLTGNWTFSGGTTTITGPDSTSLNFITVSGGTVNFNGSGTLAPPVLSVSSGTLAGSQSLVAGALNWTGGTISLGVLFNGGGFSSGSLLLDGGMLTNSGVLNWSNNATLDDGNGSVFTNLPGATIIVSNTSSTTWVNGGYYTTGSHVFGNGGTITVGASGTLAMNFENFVNAGTLTVNSGTLSLSGGTQNLANGTLNFGISNLTSFGSVSFSGAADLGGTLTATFNNPTFAPAVNDAWQVMTYGSLVGAFSKTNLPPIVGWQTIAGSKNYTIQIKQLYQPVFVQDLSPTNYALVGAPALLSVQVEGNPPFTNQWYSEAGGITNALNNGDRGGRVTVAATSLNSTNVELSLTISNAQTIDAGPYQVFVTNGYYPYWAASSVGQLVVEPEPLFNVNGSLWTLNGGATIQNNLLTLTDGQPGGETRSAFFNFPMYCQAFRVSFTYQSGLGTTSTRADGVTFCLQNTAIGTGAVGIGGGSLGYKGITNSMAIAIDQFNAKGYEYVTKGQDPATLGQYVQTTPAIDPSGGDPINVSIVYQTNAISLSMTDAVTMGTFVTNFTVGPLPITSATAFVGFTGGSGDLDSVQTISNFTFIPIPPMSAARSGASVLVSWPAGIGGYQLESSTNLGTGDWLTLPGPYNAAGQQYQFLITPTGNAFYRLALP
ncbi:MAG: beta strand repeat-containing protein [Limisphaerales bacterium]